MANPRPPQDPEAAVAAVPQSRDSKIRTECAGCRTNLRPAWLRSREMSRRGQGRAALRQRPRRYLSREARPRSQRPPRLVPAATAGPFTTAVRAQIALRLLPSIGNRGSGRAAAALPAPVPYCKAKRGPVPGAGRFAGVHNAKMVPVAAGNLSRLYTRGLQTSAGTRSLPRRSTLSGRRHPRRRPHGKISHHAMGPARPRANHQCATILHARTRWIWQAAPRTPEKDGSEVAQSAEPAHTPKNPQGAQSRTTTRRMGMAGGA